MSREHVHERDDYPGGYCLDPQTTRSEPRTQSGLFLRNGLEAMGYDEASANEAITAIEAEAASPPPAAPPLASLTDEEADRIAEQSASPEPDSGLDAGRLRRLVDAYYNPGHYILAVEMEQAADFLSGSVGDAPEDETP